MLTKRNDLEVLWFNDNYLYLFLIVFLRVVEGFGPRSPINDNLKGATYILLFFVPEFSEHINDLCIDVLEASSLEPYKSVPLQIKFFSILVALNKVHDLIWLCLYLSIACI